jgi:putative flippase GtrA
MNHTITPELIANLVGIAAATIWNFSLNYKFTWNKN